MSSLLPELERGRGRSKKRAEDDKQDCIDCWCFYQKKAEAIVAVDDPIARNRRINAAYAQLWLDDHRFQWAGLAAFASKQVGCGLLNAAEMIGKSASDSAANLCKVTSVGPAAWMMAYGAQSAAGAARSIRCWQKATRRCFWTFGRCTCSTGSLGWSGSKDACQSESSCAALSRDRLGTVSRSLRSGRRH
ncbi:hypothetical protein PQQ53_18115 [Paraburkholderia strydomiana]